MTRMKTNVLIASAVTAVLASGSIQAAGPPGVWTQSSATEGIMLYVLPSGLFFGSLSTGYPGCTYLIAGTGKGGTAVSGANLVALNTPTLSTEGACGSKVAGTGGALFTQEGVNVKFTLVTTTLKATYTLTPLPSAYESPSSLESLSGQWINPWTQRTEFVLTDGAFTAYDPASGCTETGQYSVVDAKHSLYQFTEYFSGCLVGKFGGVGVFNGVALIGPNRQLTRFAARWVDQIADGTGTLAVGDY
jgi:hypothetical protein